VSPAPALFPPPPPLPLPLPPTPLPLLLEGPLSLSAEASSSSPEERSLYSKLLYRALLPPSASSTDRTSRLDGDTGGKHAEELPAQSAEVPHASEELSGSTPSLARGFVMMSQGKPVVASPAYVESRFDALTSLGHAGAPSFDSVASAAEPLEPAASVLTPLKASSDAMLALPAVSAPAEAKVSLSVSPRAKTKKAARATSPLEVQHQHQHRGSFHVPAPPVAASAPVLAGPAVAQGVTQPIAAHSFRQVTWWPLGGTVPSATAGNTGASMAGPGGIDLLLGSDQLTFAYNPATLPPNVVSRMRAGSGASGGHGSEGGTRRISMHLRQAHKSFSQAEVLDLYLDAKMSGADVGLVYHDDGRVVSCEILGPQNVPSLCNPPLLVHAIEANAALLLRFLKEVCSKDGASYWIYRAAGETAIRVCELTHSWKDAPNTPMNVSQANAGGPSNNKSAASGSNAPGDALPSGSASRPWRYRMALLCQNHASFVSVQLAEMRQALNSLRTQALVDPVLAIQRAGAVGIDTQQLAMTIAGASIAAGLPNRAGSTLEKGDQVSRPLDQQAALIVAVRHLDNLRRRLLRQSVTILESLAAEETHEIESDASRPIDDVSPPYAAVRALALEQLSFVYQELAIALRDGTEDTSSFGVDPSLGQLGDSIGKDGEDLPSSDWFINAALSSDDEREGSASLLPSLRRPGQKNASHRAAQASKMQAKRSSKHAAHVKMDSKSAVIQALNESAALLIRAAALHYKMAYRIDGDRVISVVDASSEAQLKSVLSKLLLVAADIAAHLIVETSGGLWTALDIIRDAVLVLRRFGPRAAATDERRRLLTMVPEYTAVRIVSVLADALRLMCADDEAATLAQADSFSAEVLDLIREIHEHACANGLCDQLGLQINCSKIEDTFKQRNVNALLSVAVVCYDFCRNLSMKQGKGDVEGALSPLPITNPDAQNPLEVDPQYTENLLRRFGECLNILGQSQTRLSNLFSGTASAANPQRCFGPPAAVALFSRAVDIFESVGCSDVINGCMGRCNVAQTLRVLGHGALQAAANANTKSTTWYSAGDAGLVIPMPLEADRFLWKAYSVTKGALERITAYAATHAAAGTTPSGLKEAVQAAHEGHAQSCLILGVSLSTRLQLSDAALSPDASLQTLPCCSDPDLAPVGADPIEFLFHSARKLYERVSRPSKTIAVNFQLLQHNLHLLNLRTGEAFATQKSKVESCAGDAYRCIEAPYVAGDKQFTPADAVLAASCGFKAAEALNEKGEPRLAARALEYSLKGLQMALQWTKTDTASKNADAFDAVISAADVSTALVCSLFMTLLKQTPKDAAGSLKVAYASCLKHRAKISDVSGAAARKASGIKQCAAISMDTLADAYAILAPFVL
jgi:hypothetical protein